MQSCKQLLIEAGYEAGITEKVYRLDVDNTIAMLVHHGAQQLLKPLQFNAIAYWLPLISDTENKCYSVLESPNLQARISRLEQITFICCE